MPNKTTTRRFFLAIRHGDLGLVSSMLGADSDLVRARAAAPPKKDDGQSPLQVALKTGHTEIANLLLDRGADPTFMEESAVNAWRAPALHDALRGAVAWIGPHTSEGARRFEAHAALVERMLALGADPNAVDSFGNTCFERVAMDVRQKNRTDSEWAGAAGNDVRRIVEALVAKGGDRRRLGQHGTTAAFWMEGHPAAHLFEP
jgi:ankyrin repeat protein